MFRIDSTDRWHWSADVLPSLDFCVRALRVDGLAIPPFDRHPDGDGTLREHGLDAATWLAWVANLVLARLQVSALARANPSPGWSTSDRSAMEDLATLFQRPASACPGSPELHGRLDDLWAIYEPEGRRWMRATTREQHRDRLSPPAQRWLWEALRPLHDRLETISVFLVDYQAPVALPVRPFACLIATDPSDRDGWGYARLVLGAAERLAGG